jgi:hypothetical protein
MGNKRSTLLFETTEVPAAKSLGELTAVLVAAGATSIQTFYDGGKPAGVEWSMTLYGQRVWFAMPAKVEPVFQKLLKRRNRYAGRAEQEKLRDTAERVAWRQLLMWCKVQMALIDLGMAEYGQVFLPYAKEHPAAPTVWDVFAERKFKQLPPAGGAKQ